MKKNVLFILSTNYAGSHYLSLLAGSHSQAAHLGEIRRLQSVPVRKQPCYKCGDYTRCPMLRGVEAGKVQRIHNIILGNLPETRLLVDNSKKVTWAANFLQQEGYEKKFVHLIRDPRALVRRWDMNYDTARKRWNQRLKLVGRLPSQAWRVFVAPRRMLYVYKWLAKNQAITDFLTAHRLDYKVLTYRDLACGTAGELARLMAWLGLEFEPEQIEYWNFEHHGTQKSEYEWIKEKKASYFDTRWKTFLTDQEQRQIGRHPLVKAYLKRIVVEMTDDGLKQPAIPQVAEPMNAALAH